MPLTHLVMRLLFYINSKIDKINLLLQESVLQRENLQVANRFVGTCMLSANFSFYQALQ